MGKLQWEVGNRKFSFLNISLKGRNTQINKYAQIQLQSATEVNSYKLSSSQNILPHDSVCYITICSLTIFKDIFPDGKQVYLFIQLNHKS